jgi:hypothetical protein
MSQYSIVYETNTQVAWSYEDLLAEKSLEYLLEKRFMVGKFDFKTFNILNRLANRLCNPHCEFGCDQELLKEKVRTLIAKQ